MVYYSTINGVKISA